MIGETFGRYTIVEKVGIGGMAVVYRAHDPALDRDVALKLLHPHLAERADSRARFTREAKAVARLRHPHIVEIFDYSPPDSERAYIISEFIDGPTLRKFGEETQIRFGEAGALLLAPIADALKKAHSSGVIHRDVKPENIMIRRDGSPVLMDFGIAQMIDMPTLTATGTMLGSPAHMAPEVIDGKEIGAAADVFSLGTALYWLVCGALPFSAPNPSALFRQILETRYDPVLQRRPRAGRALARLVEQCLNRDASARPTSGELSIGLSSILEELSLTDQGVERLSFVRDPQVYQDNLPARFLPSLISSAERALDDERIAPALDALDRALFHDPRNEKAAALLKSIERGRRHHDRRRLAVMGAAILLPLVCAVALVSWYFPTASGPQRDAATVLGTTSTMGTTENEGTVEGVTELQEPESPSGTSEASQASAVPLQSTEVPTSGTRAESPTIVNKAEKLDDTSPMGTAPVGDAPVIVTATERKQTRRRRRSRPRPATPAATPETRPGAASAEITPNADAKPLLVPIHGQHKGAEVYLNGRLHPLRYLYRLETEGGIRLLPGRHRIRFENPGCERYIRTVVIQPGQTKAPKVAFKCTLKPATIRVDGPPGLEVRRDDGRLIGSTNQDISLPIDKMRAPITLTIGTPGDKFAKRKVILGAGERRVVQVEF